MPHQNDPLWINEALQLLHRDLELKNHDDAPQPNELMPQTYDALRLWLAQIIADWLTNRPDYLRLALYRLDISEKKARAAILQPDNAFRLADLIIEREWQKVQTRAQYRAWCKQNPPHNSPNNDLSATNIDNDEDMLL